MPTGQLKHEVEIVWEEDISDIDYVRVNAGDAGTRQRGVPWNFERVGYAVLAEDAPNIGWPMKFLRRVFWLKPHDRYNDPDGVYSSGCPAEAVDPRTVEPGEEGELTDRAWGGDGLPEVDF